MTVQETKNENSELKICKALSKDKFVEIFCYDTELKKITTVLFQIALVKSSISFQELITTTKLSPCVINL